MDIPAGTQNPYISILPNVRRKQSSKRKKDKIRSNYQKKVKKNSRKSLAEGLSATESTLSADESEN